MVKKHPKKINFEETSLKFKYWVELFMDKSNPEFYGNKTRCALKAYNTSNYNSASCIGYQNYRKLQFLASYTLEEDNMGFPKLLKIGLSKVIKGSYRDWESFMEFLGYFEPRKK